MDLGLPLHAAAMSSCTAVVSILPNAGTDVNIEGGYHGRPLQTASHLGTGSATIPNLAYR